MSEFLESIENLLRNGNEQSALKLVKEKSKGREDDFAIILSELGDCFLIGIFEDIKIEDITIGIGCYELANKIVRDNQLLLTIRKRLSGLYDNLALKYIYINELKLAKKYYKKALNLDPDSNESRYMLGIVSFLMRNYKNAETCFREVVKFYPHYADARFAHGLVLCCLKEYTRAEKELRKLVEIDTDYIRAYNLLAYLLIETKRYDEAEEILCNIMKRNPNDVLTYHNLGRCYYNSGKYEEAESTFNKAKEIESNPHPSLHISCGIAYLKNLKLDHARNAFNTAKNDIKKTKNSIKPEANNYKLSQHLKGYSDEIINVCEGFLHLIESLINWNSSLYAKAMEDIIIARRFFDKTEEPVIPLQELTNLQELIKLEEHLFNLLDKPDESLVKILPSLVNKTGELTKRKGGGLLISYYHCIKTFNQSLNILRDKRPSKISLADFRKAKAFFFTETNFEPGIRLVEKVEPFILKSLETSEKIKDASEEEKEKSIHDLWQALATSKVEILENLNGKYLKILSTELVKPLIDAMVPHLEPLGRMETDITGIREKQEELLELKEVIQTSTNIDEIIKQLQGPQKIAKRRILCCFKDEKEMQTHDVRNKIANLFEREYKRETVSKNLSYLSREELDILRRKGRGSNIRYELTDLGKEVMAVILRKKSNGYRGFRV